MGITKEESWLCKIDIYVNLITKTNKLTNRFRKSAGCVCVPWAFLFCDQRT